MPPAESKGIYGTSNSSSPPIQNVCVDHRCFHVLVAEQFLDGSDVIAVFQQMRGKRVSERVAGGALHNPRFSHGFLDGALDGGFMDMIEAGESIPVEAGKSLRSRRLQLPYKRRASQRSGPEADARSGVRRICLSACER